MEINQMSNFSMSELQRDLKEEQELNKDLFTTIRGNATAQDLTLFGDSEGVGSSRQPMNISEEQKKILIISLIEENEQLKQLISKMTLDRNNAQSKAMLIDQQSQGTIEFKGQVEEIQEDHLKELRKALIAKEKEIQEKEKIPAEQNPTYLDPGILIINKDLVLPMVDNLKRHDEIETIKKEIEQTLLEISSLEIKRKAIYRSIKNLNHQVTQFENALLSSNCKKSKQETFTDDEDFNAAHAKKPMINFVKVLAKKRIKEEKKMNPQKEKSALESIPNNAMSSLRTQKLPQVQIDLEKYRNLTQNWRTENEEKLANIQKLQHYNSTLEKSNVQLVENSTILHQRAQKLNAKLTSFKKSYQALLDLKKQKLHLSFNPCTPSSMGQFQSNGEISPFLINSNSSRGNINKEQNLGNSIYNHSIFQVKAKDLISVEEEEIDEDIVRRKTLSAYQSVGSKINTEVNTFYPSDPFQEFNQNQIKEVWKGKVQSVEYLYKVQQQTDRIIKSTQPSTIISSNPKYLIPSLVPPPLIPIKKSLSFTEGYKDEFIWCEKKKQVPHYLKVSSRYESKKIPEEVKQQEDSDDNDDDEVPILIQLSDESDDDEKEEKMAQNKDKNSIATQQENNRNSNNKARQEIGNSQYNSKKSNMNSHNQHLNQVNANQAQYILENEADILGTKNSEFNSLPQQAHNNSFFRELDISVIHKQFSKKQ